jgi:hypothetical protein
MPFGVVKKLNSYSSNISTHLYLKDVPVWSISHHSGAEEEPPSVNESWSTRGMKIAAISSVHLKPDLF